MKNIKRILLALDGIDQQDALIASVVAFTKKTDVQVTLLSVLDRPPSKLEVGIEPLELKKLMTEDRLEQLENVASELRKHAVQVTVKVSHGKRYIEIIRESLSSDYDLIMKPAGSESRIKSVFFGSTDMQLFHLCPCPVWAFKPTHRAQLNKIMIAVDLLPSDKEKSALADKVLQWGNYIAGLANAELHVIHTWEMFGEGTLRSRSVLANTVDKLVEDEKQRHKKWLEDAFTRNGLLPEQVHLHFHKGEAKALIPSIVNDYQIDLLVMGTVGRIGIPGFFVGNTADSVLRQVNCSVLAIKPDGFISPVE